MRISLIGIAASVGLGCGSQASPVTALPQVENSGGPVLAEPTLVSVSFGSDPMASLVDSFVQALPGSAFSRLAQEYGVDAMIAATPVHSSLQLGATVDDAFWQKQLPVELEQSLDGFGPPPAQAVYVLFMPPGVTVTASGQTGCQDFGGYHSAVALLNGTRVAYAVVARCASFNGLDQRDSITGVASHEILESASDPYYALNDGAWANVDSAALVFELVFGGEIADLCLNSLPAFYTPSDLPYVVQRTWSNRAALQGDDPCVPAPAAPAEPYFQSVPQLADNAQVHLNGDSQTTRGVSLEAGQSITIPVDLYSASPTTGPWNLTVLSLSSGSVSGKFDRSSGINGDQVHLTLTLQAAGSLEGASGIEAIGILSELGSRKQVWPILVATP